MARKTRIEVEGGLYHLITRGNGRRDIFHSRQDHDKFLHILMAQKHSLPFYLEKKTGLACDSRDSLLFCGDPLWVRFILPS